MIVLLLLICIVLLLIIGVVGLVRRRRRGRIDRRVEAEVDTQVHDSAENTNAPIETGTSHPHSYVAPETTILTGRRVDMRRSCIYCSVSRAKVHPQNSLMASLLIRNKSNGSMDGGSTEGDDDNNAMYEDISGADVHYQSIRENQVQVHHYASLGAAVQEEGSAQSYI